MVGTNGKTNPHRGQQLGRVLAGLDLSEEIDHRDRNPLNFCRDNLRPATDSQQGANRGKNVTNTSGSLGVNWVESRQRWRGRIKVNGREINRYFINKADAAMRKP